MGALVDLGTSDELRARLGDARLGLAVRRPERERHPDRGDVRPRLRLRTGTVEVPESTELFSGSPTDMKDVQVGHIYLGRITSTYDPAYQILFKFLVTKNLPDTEATIRYRVMVAQCGSQDAQRCTPIP